MTAKFHVARVLSGPRLPPVIIVQYFGHTFIKDGKMRLKLRRGDGEIYLVCAPAGSTGVQCPRSEEHTSELQSLMRISYAVFCLKKKRQAIQTPAYTTQVHTQT